MSAPHLHSPTRVAPAGGREAAPASAMTVPQASSNRRSKKLIEPRTQLRFVRLFITTSAFAVLVQALVMSYLMMTIADRMPNDGVQLKSQMLNLLATGLGITLVLLVPLTLVVGIASTHKVVGPLYRFRVYLTQLAAGENPPPCRIRRDDELQDLCELLNRATEPLRTAPTAAAPRKEAA